MNRIIAKTFTSLTAILMLLSLIMSSCEYEFIEVDLPDPNIPVNFSSDILPIFNANNNCTACHKTGGTSPDLTTDRAYNSIVPSLINTANPELSKIYVYPNPSSPNHGFKKYTQVQAALVLAWITQGAENN
jgi:hypothetical protein